MLRETARVVFTGLYERKHVIVSAMVMLVEDITAAFVITRHSEGLVPIGSKTQTGRVSYSE